MVCPAVAQAMQRMCSLHSRTSQPCYRFRSSMFNTSFEILLVPACQFTCNSCRPFLRRSRSYCSSGGSRSNRYRLLGGDKDDSESLVWLVLKLVNPTLAPELRLVRGGNDHCFRPSRRMAERARGTRHEDYKEKTSATKKYSFSGSINFRTEGLRGQGMLAIGLSRSANSSLGGIEFCERLMIGATSSMAEPGYSCADPAHY